MKKYIYVFVLLFVNVILGQEINNNTDDDKTVIEIPKDFFSGMFRVIDDDYLVAWAGSVKVAEVISGEGVNSKEGSVEPFIAYLNEGFASIFSRYFDYNMKDGKKQLITKNKKTWAARCGLKSTSNINISAVTGEDLKGFPPDITSDVWANHFTFKKVHRDSKTKKSSVITYIVHARSIYFYHKKGTDLTGTIKRTDDYNLCGQIVLQRIGPESKLYIESTKVSEEKYEFKENLYRGDYYVNYQWPSGASIRLEDDFVYNPTGQKMLPDFEIESFEGTISGKVKYKNTDEYVKNYPVKLVPICSDSGLPEKETNTNEDGEYEFKNVPQGEYQIVVKTAKDILVSLVDITKPEIEPEDSEISFKYDIILTYTAPGFARAKLVWKNTKIRFPEDGEKIQFLDIMAYKNSGATEHPNGTDGKPLDIPYSMIIPGIGKQTLYGWPESETATPEVLFVASLGGKGVYTKFKVNLEEDALNNCNISQIGNGPIYLEIGFDLTGKYPDEGGWQQEAVYCLDNKEVAVTGGTFSAYPIHFKQHKFNKQEIEKFKSNEDFDLAISNGKATLKIEFIVAEATQ